MKGVCKRCGNEILQVPITENVPHPFRDNDHCLLCGYYIKSPEEKRLYVNAIIDLAQRTGSPMIVNVSGEFTQALQKEMERRGLGLKIDFRHSP